MPRLRKQTGRYQVQNDSGGWMHLQPRKGKAITWYKRWRVVDTAGDRDGDGLYPVVLRADRMRDAQGAADHYNAGHRPPRPEERVYLQAVSVKRSRA